MDLHFGTDLFESFRRYQWRLIREYNRMSREFGFVTIDARLTPEEIQIRIRRKVQALLDERKVRALTASLETLRPLLFETEEDEAEEIPARDELPPASAASAPDQT